MSHGVKKALYISLLRYYAFTTLKSVGEDLESTAVIGAGMIGGAIVKSLLKKGEGEVIATRRSLEKSRSLKH